jgi:hypothetical protein
MRFNNLDYHGINLLTIIQKDVRLKRVASSGGGEWAGPCPFCADHGNDRFRVQPYAVDKPRWLCRKCTDGKWRDAIDYIRRRDGINFSEVLRVLQLPEPMKSPSPPRVNVQASFSVSIWQKRSLAFVEECEVVLHSTQGQRAFQYLKNRGLSETTIRKYRLGFHVGDPSSLGTGQLDYDAATWGFEDTQIRSIHIPPGIVIPSMLDGAVYTVKIRKAVAPGDTKTPKYIQIKGGQPAIFGAGNLVHSDAIFTEGEFDAMLLDQEVGDLIGVATLGSATSNFSGIKTLTSWRYLLPLRRILVVFDADQPGQRGVEKLREGSNRVIPLKLPELPGVKDITDYWSKGGDLRRWALESIDRLNSDHVQRIDPVPQILPPIQQERAMTLTEKYLLALEMPWQVNPEQPCFICGHMNYQPYPDGSGFVCATCHP